VKEHSFSFSRCFLCLELQVLYAYPGAVLAEDGKHDTWQDILSSADVKTREHRVRVKRMHQ